jgi:uncharacterized membrane protein YbhN (UPF0104 family)
MSAGDHEESAGQSGQMAKLFGRALTVAAIGFVAWEINQQWDALSQWQPSGKDVLQTGGQSLLYGASLYLLAFNWQMIVGAVSNGELPHRLTLYSYTDTQIAKYIPGNVAHLVSRHVRLRNRGVSDKELGLAALLELISLPLAAVLTAAFFMTVWPIRSATRFADLFSGPAPLVIVLLGLVAGLASFVLPPRLQWSAAARIVSLAVLIACLFMGLLGLNLSMTLSLFASSPPSTVIPAAILAWLVGFLTPGSPGGIGTREASILLLLNGIAPESTLLLTALIFRMVTIGGDVVCYLSGRLLLSPDRD